MMSLMPSILLPYALFSLSCAQAKKLNSVDPKRKLELQNGISIGVERHFVMFSRVKFIQMKDKQILAFLLFDSTIKSLS
jgi:hypothetical protein